MTPKITIHTTTEDTPKAMAPTDDDGTDSVVCGVSVAVNKNKVGCYTSTKTPSGHTSICYGKTVSHPFMA